MKLLLENWREYLKEEEEKWIRAYRAENAGRGITTDAIEGGVYFFPRREPTTIEALEESDRLTIIV